MSKRSTLELGLPTYRRRKVYKGKGISREDADIVEEAAKRKIQELSKRLKSKRFRERLEKQGVGIGEGVLENVDDTVRATPVYGAHGVYTERGKNPIFRTKHERNPLSAGTGVRVNPSGIKHSFEAPTLLEGFLPRGKKIKKVTRHELEHAFDESFKAANPGKSLSQAQAPLLKKLGAKGEKDPRYSPGEIRTDIMELRDEIGSEDVSAKQLKKYINQYKDEDPGNLPRAHGMIRRAVEANPDMSLEDLAKLINSVAMRRRKNTRMA